MRRILSLALCLLLGAGLAGCGAGISGPKFPPEMGVDIRQGEVTEERETHGGFHGDGYTWLQAAYPPETGDALTEGFHDGGVWKRLPLPKELETAAYGSAEREPLTALADGAAIPPVESGYYWFRDRHSESKDPADPAELFDRYSYNFDLAVYDTDTDILYYFALDT